MIEAKLRAGRLLQHGVPTGLRSQTIIARRCPTIIFILLIFFPWLGGKFFCCADQKFIDEKDIPCFISQASIHPYHILIDCAMNNRSGESNCA